ncbi:HAD domain-containing protein [Streptomyces albidoflavus]|uniref:HAD domain-containing protein n=1 Tax=Streptomyces albidoflavus TaxID=1886 RepID=UPI003321ECFB
MSDRPLILLDVDGVLNAFRRPGPEWQRFRRMGFHLWLNPAHGPSLLKLAAELDCELVWATTWEHNANTEIAPLVGLPELPVIEVGRPRQLPDANVLWKTPAVADYVNGRPFLWFDDDVDENDRAYLAAHDNVAEFLLIVTNGDDGLTTDHLEQARAWLSQREASDG